MFSQRLDYVMNIANIKNSVLAATVKMDASHISRLRNGKRTPPMNQNYIMPMALFIARRIREPFASQVICDTLHIDRLPDTNEETAQLIYDWLLDSKSDSLTTADRFINSFVVAHDKRPFETKREEATEGERNEQTFYIGNTGKREAVLKLFNELLKEKEPQTLLLFSDEEMTWMTEEKEFLAKCTGLLMEVLKHGNKIRIIHTMNRGTDEMLEGVSQWLPLYITGMIEPYYYPKLRDGLYQRTVLIAPRTGAIISDSIRFDSSEMLNQYIESPRAIEALIKEFERYLSLCHKLMNIYGAESKEMYFKDLMDFAKYSAPSIMVMVTPSIKTMPEQVAKAIAGRCQSPQFYDVWSINSSQFSEFGDNPVYEIIPSFPSSEGDRIFIPMASMIAKQNLYYTKEEYILHLENVLRLMRENDNYTVVLNDNYRLPVLIWCKEDYGAFITHIDKPLTVFSSKEQSICATFWAYTGKLLGSPSHYNHEHAIERLQEHIDEMRRHLSK